MQSVAKGDLAQLAVLFDRHHKRIYNFFFKMHRNKMISEDLTQEVFVKIMRHRKSFKNGNFTAWIYTIARNVFADYYQKLKRERNTISDTEISNLQQQSSANENQEEIDHLQKALLNLNTSDRELIIMHRFQEIQYAQIAEIIGSSEGAVKTKVHRALKKLKDIYFKTVRHEM